MLNAIIYGCGFQGNSIYNKYKHQYNIVNFADSNEKLHGTEFLGLKVLSPLELKTKLADSETALIVASMYYRDIFDGLSKIGINLGNGKVYFSPVTSGMLCEYPSINSLNFEGYNFKRFKGSLNKTKIQKVLFVQESECTRTAKISKSLSELGIRVDFAYLDNPSASYDTIENRYAYIYHIQNFDDFFNFLNDSDYDIIHSSNEADSLTALMINSNKPVVHDCHDLISVSYTIRNYHLIEEYISQKFSAGNLYTTELFEKYVVKKYNLSGKPTFNISNSITRELKPKKYMNKLSEKTNEIHCVYSGGMLPDEDENDIKYFRNIFRRIAEQKIHVHFYIPKPALVYASYFKSLENESPYIHFEGSLEYSDLMDNLTQYDVGLCYYNVTAANEFVISIASPNKIYEYLHAELPIAGNNLPIITDLINKYGCGGVLDLEGDIVKQFSDIKSIKVSPTLLEDNGLLMENQAEKLIEFYKDVIEYYNHKS